MVYRKRLRRTRRYPRPFRRTMRRKFKRSRRTTGVTRILRSFTLSRDIYSIPFTGYAFDASLASMSHYSEITNLFSEYKIPVMNVDVFWNRDPTLGSTDANNSPDTDARNPLTFFMYKNVNGTGAPGSTDEVEQIGKKYLKPIMGASRLCRFKISPSALAPTYQTGLTNAYSSRKCPWISTAYTGVPLYGFKWGVINSGLAPMNPTRILGTVTFNVRYTILARRLQ